MLISLVDGAVQAGVQASSRSSGAVIYTPSGSADVLTEVLKDTLQIPPTVVKRNGERIQVLVARDVDFRSVYELRTAVH
jgi:type IV secretion system protein VirB10